MNWVPWTESNGKDDCTLKLIEPYRLGCSWDMISDTGDQFEWIKCNKCKRMIQFDFWAFGVCHSRTTVINMNGPCSKVRYLIKQTRSGHEY